MGPQPIVQSVVNPSQSLVPSPMVIQQQVPQYMPPTMAPSMPIPITARSSGPYLQQPFSGPQSLPMYAHQPQYSTSGYASSYMYGTPATTQYAPGSVGGSFVLVQDRSPSPPRHHCHSSGHRHHCGHRRRHRCSHRRHRTYSDPEYDHRFRRY